MGAVKILIADDHKAFRRSLRSLLESRAQWRVCGEAADGEQAVAKAKKLRPRVILMDISMPRMDGAEATRIIRREVPESEVIIVSQNDEAVLSRQAAELGARSYESKANVARDLILSIDAVLAADAQFVASPKVASEIPSPNESPRVMTTQAFDASVSGSGEDAPVWLHGGGKMGELIRNTEWRRTPLGPTKSWSPALRMIVKFLLANRFPQLLWWGNEFCSIYNDAYIPILGSKHPWALGRPVSEVWKEIWHVLRPLIETPFSGGPATWMEDIPLEINRRGFFEETHFTIAYSPVPDESVPGGIGGVLATVHEITEKVVGERRVSSADLNLSLHSRPRCGQPRSAKNPEACLLTSAAAENSGAQLPGVDAGYRVDHPALTVRLPKDPALESKAS